MSSTPRGGPEEVLWAKNPPAPAERSQTPAPHDFESLEIFPSTLGRLELTFIADKPPPHGAYQEVLGIKGAKSFYLPGIQGISTGMADFGETLK